jgi:hypothetical protein
MPASMGNPLVANRRSDRANTKGSTGNMHGLKIVSTPPKNTNAASTIGTSTRAFVNQDSDTPERRFPGANQAPH